jgi:hypothetical protein
VRVVLHHTSAPLLLSLLLLLLLLLLLIAGPDGIPAGQQVCISYGNWPAEPFLLLFGFVPQPNPHDSITLFSSLQHMADCYLGCCAAALQAAAGAGSSGTGQQGAAAATAAKQLLQSEAFAAVFAQQVDSIEEQVLQQQESGTSTGGPGGFRDMIVNASGIDGRLATALSYIHQAVAVGAAAAVQQDAGSSSDTAAQQQQPGAASTAAVQQLQLPLGAVLQHRLKKVVEQLERSRGNSSRSIQRPGVQQQQQQGDAAVDADGEESGCYTESAAHTELIQQYCSSKAALAQQLAGQYSGSAVIAVA